MAYDLNAIYDRTSGYCHICARKLAYTNYGVVGAKGAWEVEHSRAKAHGGTDHGNNLYAACIPCNREKSHRFSTRAMRARNDRGRAPLSIGKRREAKQTQALAGAALFGIAGYAFGPIGALIGVAVGAAFGEKQNPDRR